MFSYLFFGFWQIISEKVGYEYKYRYLYAVLKQEAAWFDANNSQELPSKISAEWDKIQKASGEKFIMIYNGIATSLGGFISAFSVGWKYAFAALGTFPFLMVGLILLIVGIKAGYIKAAAAYAKSGGYVEQALNNIKVVAAFGQEKREIDNYTKHLDEAKKAGQKGKAIIALSLGTFNLLLFASYAYGLYVGGLFVKNRVYNPNKDRDFTSGDIISIFFGVVIGIFSMGGSAPNAKVVAEGRIAAYIALQVINRVPKILIDDPLSHSCQKIKGDIILENISFKYEKREEQALKNVSWVIEEGKTTAFVGPSGSGKSTIVKIIERFYDPDEGRIIVNNEDLKKLNLRQFRHRIGYVGQEPVLFNESIKNNLLNSKEDATDDEILAALEQANALKFIERLKDGINTNAGASGGQLSGGEKQRIALARAFLRNPDVLILDEATSALDRKNEAEVQKAIEGIKKQKTITTIVIAHRLSTIKNADKIIVIDKGEIKEQGSHQYLLNNYPDGIYAGLVNTQQENQDSSENETPDENDIKSMHSINDDEDLPDKLEQPITLAAKKSEEHAPRKEEIEITKEVNKEEEKLEDQIKANRILRKKKGFFKRLLVHNKPVIFIFVGIVASLFVGALFPSFAVFWTKVLFVMMDTDMDRMSKDLLKYWGILLLIGFIALFAVTSEKFSFGCLGENMSRNIREEWYGSILRKHVGWFDHPENTAGQLTTILSTEVNTLNGASTESLSIMFQAFVGLVIGITLAFYYEWRISLVALGVAPFMMIAGAINSKVKAGGLISIDRSDAKINSTVSDSIINYITVSSFANEHLIIEKYKANLSEKVNKEIRKCHISGLLFGFSQFMQFAMYTILFWSGAKFVENNGVSGQDMFTAIYVMMFAAIGAGQAQQHGPSAGKGIEAAWKIYDIIDEPSSIDPFEVNRREIIADNTNIKGEIEFKNVWFRYPTRKDQWILKGLSMKIHRNECVGLVGQSGGGKSTIIQLIYRFYEPQRGEIFVDGVNIKNYNIKSLRAQFGLVQQEPVLFNYTVRENICYAKEDASIKEILSAAQIANAAKFIEDAEEEKEQKQFPDSAMEPLRNEQGYEGLPNGYNTMCGVKGSKFSGGQKQRIAVARAIITQPQILMLDEATSALDEESQRKVQEALDNVMKNRTSIIIAHRLTTIKKWDRLIVLDQGVVCEEGTFDELVRRGGQFAHISSDMQS